MWYWTNSFFTHEHTHTITQSHNHTITQSHNHIITQTHKHTNTCKHFTSLFIRLSRPPYALSYLSPLNHSPPIFSLAIPSPPSNSLSLRNFGWLLYILCGCAITFYFYFLCLPLLFFSLTCTPTLCCRSPIFILPHQLT